MHQTDDFISNFIQSQFPAVYQQDGPLLVAFTRAYFEYLEQDAKTINQIRSLSDYRDIDETLDSFVKYFKSKFLNGIQFSTRADQRFLVKHAFDLYKAKGSKRSYELLFRLLYDEDIEVTFPGEQVLKPSDGDFFEPIYLEIENAARAETFLGKEITGSTSGAKAFVESIARKIVSGKSINQLFISNVRGNFSTGELITDNGVLENAPKVVGSLTEIAVINGGQDNEVGDFFEVEGANGKQGRVRVTAIEDGTGRVDFVLEDGGFGFTLTDQTEVKVSTGILNVRNITGTFAQYETVEAPLNTIDVLGINGTFNVGDIVVGANSTNNSIANGFIVNANDSNTFVVSVLSGNYSSAAELQVLNDSNTNATIDVVTNSSITANLIGLNATSLGVFGNSGTFIANNAYIKGNTTNASANIFTITTGANAIFSVGSLENEETLTLYTDLIGGNNDSGVAYLDILLDASNSNTTGYGFPKDPTANISDVISTALSSNTFTIGTISAISGINPGQNYNADPFVSIRTPLIAGFNRQDLILNINTLSGSFRDGETVNQTLNISSVELDIADVTGTFEVAEGVIQTTSGANGVVYAANSTVLTLVDLRGSFDGTNPVTGFVSGATANVTAVTANNVEQQAKGIVASANTSEVILKRISFATSFEANTTIVGATSNASANVVSVRQDADSNPIGFNANVTSTVKAAQGIATTVEVVDSGYGYEDNTVINMTSSNSNFVMTGTSSVLRQGIGEGFWKDTKSFLNSDQRIHDNSYYQDYSYVIKSGLSIDKYSDLLKDIFHVAGTELFGEVVKQSTALEALNLNIAESSISSA